MNMLLLAAFLIVLLAWFVTGAVSPEVGIPMFIHHMEVALNVKH